MVWTNPAGMEVRLEKYKIKKSPRIRLHLPYGGKVSIAYWEEDRKKGLNAGAQGRAITASVVHSFDAAHLAKTVNACSRAGIRSFAVVHDSYGTHACDAPAMARLLREQFVEIYSQSWLERLAEQWQEDAPDGVEVRTPPARGDLDITQVVHSEHFFC
jgi:DNA-directed RNA polymerase